MPRSKKGTGQPPDQNPPDSESHDSAENEGMAHIGADALAGSPDVFAAKKASSPEPAPLSSDERDVVAEPEAAAPEPAAQPVPIATMERAPEFSPAPPPRAVPPPTPARRSGTGMALGVVLVVVGAFYLIVQVAGIDLSVFGWPLFVIIAGLTLLVVGFASLGTGAAIPGGILTMVGLVLAYQNSTGHWTSWAYAWALVAPGGVGLGLFLQGIRERNTGLIRQGRSLMFIALLIFMVGFVLFESIFNISDINDLPVVKAALPALFILIGVLLLARSIQNSRRA
ncbi:MAG: hypothetical protein QOJ10_1303 [Chloroflexota bacterium]|jgi:hypothetical protein|nr:hypothetical protein [Chloroflexota bacterium]